MRSRALSLAALAFLVGLFEWPAAGVRPAAAQQLDAGKPPAQIFSGTCAACHRSPRGLVRSVSPGSLPGFLRQHYTTGNDMAGVMATYVLGNGGTQPVAEPPAKREPKQKAKSDTPEVAVRTPEPKELPKAAKQQKAGKKGQPEPPGARDTPATGEPEKPDAVKPEAAEPAKPDTAAVDCKIDEPKQANAPAASDEGKPGFAMPTPASAPPRQPTSLLTLPGFPPPVVEPEPVAARPGCEPAAKTTAAVTRTDEPPKQAPNEPVPAAVPPAIAEAPKSEPLRPAVAEPAAPPPVLDIMQEEVHAPRPVRPGQPQQKKRAP